MPDNTTAAGHSPTIFTDLLGALGVPFTPAYSNLRFRSMNFKSLFGLSKLLKEYGVDTEGLSIADKSELSKLPTPFVAGMGHSFAVVTAMTPTEVTITANGTVTTMATDHFVGRWSGVVLMAYPAPDAAEPDYRLHRIAQTGSVVKRWLLIGLTLFLTLWFAVENGIFGHWNTIVLALIDLAGIYVSYLLMLKMLGIHSAHAERVCGVIEKGGCDTVLQQKAAKFFGLFGWSEVGLAYFSVSFIALVVAPSQLPWLAVINLLCLPFSFWSVWYQRERAHAWCTLCLTVQALLWLTFATFLTSGVLRHCLPPDLTAIAVDGAFYLLALLVINRLSPRFDRNPATHYLT